MDVLYLHTIINQINFMRRILSFAAMAAILVLGASCEGTEPENGDNGSNGNNTETPETPTDPVEAVSGTYSGALDILLSLMGGEASPVQSDLTNEIVISAAPAENTVNVQVKALSVTVTGVGTLDFGDRTFEGCTVTEAEDGSYEIAGTAEMSAEVPVFVSPVNCTVTVAGTVTGETLDLQLTVGVTEIPEFKTPAQMVAGTYDGNMIITMGTGGTPGDPTALTVEIIESGESTVTMSTSLEGIGTIEVKDCTVTANSETGGHDLSGEGVVTLSFGDCNVNFTGTKTGNELKLNITAKPALMPTMTVTVDFTGTLSASTPAE